MLAQPIKEYTVYCPFGGAGGGALGLMQSLETLLGTTARFRLIGGFDFDPYACKAFEYLTGVKEMCCDAWDLTPDMLRADAGDEAPDLILMSAPCVAASQLVSPAKAATAPYVKINSLMGHVTKVIMAAWPTRPPKLFLNENVPNLARRAKSMLDEVVKTLRASNYSTHMGRHQCRTTGNLAQNRLRFFMVARHESQVPVFLYKPPMQPGKVCRDVLESLPLPGDLMGGPMHRLPDISVLNWIRLALIPTRGTIRPDGLPAKGDWRDLKVMLAAQVDDIAARAPLSMDYRAKDAQNNVFKVTGWDQAIGAVSGAQSPANGAASAADPRHFSPVSDPRINSPRFGGSLGVLASDDVADTITAEAYPSTGRFSFADARVGSAPAASRVDASRHRRKVAPVVVSAVGQGALFGKLDMKQGPGSFANNYHVGDLNQPARTVTGATRPGGGAPSVAIPILPQASNADPFASKYVLLAWDQEARTVTGASRVGSGAQSVADVRIEAFRGAWGVLSPSEPSGTITGNARHSTGTFSIADSALLVKTANPCCYGVLSPGEASHTVTGTSGPGNGPFSIAEERGGAHKIALGCEPHAGAYWVVSLRQAIGTITASACIDNGAFAVADERFPDAAPQLWIERLDKAPRLWAGYDAKGQVKRGKKAPLVILAEDGTWHRPLTTLELAVLQGLPWMHRGRPLNFGGGSTEQRKAVGNMIPPPVAMAMGSQMLLALVAADAGAFFLDSAGGWVWCSREDYIARLRLEGVTVVDETGVAWDIGEVALCDDGAVRAKPKRKRKAARKTGKVPHVAREIGRTLIREFLQ
jgi:site-specific DNA-cytosine methylase